MNSNKQIKNKIIMERDESSYDPSAEDIENEEITLASNITDNSIFDILGISRLESVHTNFLKWLLEKGREYPTILEYFVRSIVNVKFRMGHYGQSATGIVGYVVGESFGHRVVEGNILDP